MARRRGSIAMNAAGAPEGCPTPTGMTQSPGQRGHAQAAANPSGEQMDIAGIIGQGILDMLPEGMVDEIKATASDIAGDVHEQGAAILGRINEVIEGAMEGGGSPSYDEMENVRPGAWKGEFDQRMREKFVARSADQPAAAGEQTARVQDRRAAAHEQVTRSDTSEAQKIAQRRAQRLQAMSDDALSRLAETMRSMPNASPMVNDEIAAELQRRGM